MLYNLYRMYLIKRSFLLNLPYIFTGLLKGKKCAKKHKFCKNIFLSFATCCRLPAVEVEVLEKSPFLSVFFPNI